MNRGIAARKLVRFLHDRIADERLHDRYLLLYAGCGCEWACRCNMCVQVEYWFRKLVDEPSDRSLFPRRRRQYRVLADDDLCVLSLTLSWIDTFVDSILTRVRFT